MSCLLIFHHLVWHLLTVSLSRACAACTLYHPVSTCALGPNADDVLDLEMKLRGAKGLRVVDASVFPQQISGHPTSVVLALAEKAADLIMGRSIQSSGAPIASSAAQVHA